MCGCEGGSLTRSRAFLAALRSDRLSSYEQWSLSLEDALAGEYRHGMATLATGEMFGGLESYASGGWRGQRRPN